MRKGNVVLLGEWTQAGKGVSYRDRSGSRMKRITRMLCFECAARQRLGRVSVICGTDIEKCRICHAVPSGCRINRFRGATWIRFRITWKARILNDEHRHFFGSGRWNSVQ